MAFCRASGGSASISRRVSGPPAARWSSIPRSWSGWATTPCPATWTRPRAPWSNPETAREFPFQLITGARIPGFFHTENRQTGPLRERRKRPLAEIHPQDAEKKGIASGDAIRISSPRGEVTLEAVVTDRTLPGVVAADHGWWFPEDSGSDYGWDRSNIDVLTDNDYETCDPAMGATSLRVLLCRVEKAG